MEDITENISLCKQKKSVENPHGTGKFFLPTIREFAVLWGMHMGERLKQLRESRGLTQGELGQLVGRKQQDISYLEQRGTLYAQDVPLFARALRMPVIAFYDASENDDSEIAIDWELLTAARVLPAQARQYLLGLLRSWGESNS